MKISLLTTHWSLTEKLKIFFLLGFLTITAFQTNLYSQCNPGEIEISSVCACDDGSGNVTLSVDFLNFPSGCVDGYDIGITYTRANPPGGLGSISVMGITSSPVTFPAVSDIASPSDIGIISVVSNASCGSASLPICTSTVMVMPTTGGTITSCALDQNVNTSVGLCSGIVPDLTGDIIISGGCNVTVTQSPVAGSTFGSACGDTLVVTFTMNDGCGTVEMCNATLTLVDNEAPLISGSLTTTMIEGCSLTDLPMAFTTVAEIEAAMGNPMISDNCTADGDLIVSVANDGGVGSCPIVYTRTYTIDDNCGNTSTIDHVIEIDDTVAPVITGALTNSDLEGCSLAVVPTPFTTVAEIEAAAGDVSIIDACTTNGNLMVSVSDDGGLGTCPIVLTRTYTIEDECGNTSSINHVINIDDTVDPVITGSLTPIILEGCGVSDAPAAFANVAELESAMGDVLIEDACTADADLVVTFIDNVLPIVDCVTKIQRIYTITDECSNMSTLVHMIDITDTEPPVITGSLTPVVIEGCNIGDAPAAFTTVAEIEAAMGDVLIEDACTADADLVVTYSSGGGSGMDVGVGTCPIVLTRVYTISDTCNNSSTTTITHVIEIDDTTEPNFVAPPENIAASQGLTCGTAVDPHSLEDLFGEGFPEVMENCLSGNVTPADFYAGITAPWDGTAVNVNGIEISYVDAVEVHPDGVCADVEEKKYRINRSWTITDSCDNTMTSDPTNMSGGFSFQRINIGDGDVAPTPVTVASPLSFDMDIICGVEVFASDIENGSFDNCGLDDPLDPSTFDVSSTAAIRISGSGDSFSSSIVVTSSDVDFSIACPFTLTLDFQVTDECGNTAVTTFDVQIADVTPPTITGSLTDTELEGCSIADAPAPFTTVAEIEAAMGDALIEDACNVDGDLTVTVVSDGGTGSCPTEVTRTYTISDLCGNESTIDHVIRINDTTEPTFVAPPENIASSQGLTCSMGVDPHSLEDLFGEGFPEVIENCLASNVTPADFYAGITAPWDGSPVLVNGITISYADDIIAHPLGVCSSVDQRKYRIRRSWTIEDACGNVMTSDPNEGGTGFDFQRININDGNVNPTPDATPINISMDQDCEALLLASDIENGSFDNCGIDDPLDPSTFDVSATAMIRIAGSGAPFTNSITITSSDVDFSVSCPFTLSIELQVMDECGNTGVITTEVLVEDNLNPAITGSLTDTDVEACDITGLPAAFTTVAEIEAAMGDVLIEDACTLDGDLTVTVSSDGGIGTCPIIVTRTYTITDACGNTGTIDHIINIDDSTIPSITGSISDSNVEGCSTGDAPAPFTSVADIEGAIGNADISDACTLDGDLVVTVSSDGGVGSCPIVMTRTYTITDACGNSNTIDHIINIDDSTSPVITGSLDATEVEGCGLGDLPAPFTSVAEIEAAMGDVEVTDVCTADSNLVVLIAGLIETPSCPTVVTRTYSIEDACGNMSFIDHVLNINEPALVVNCPMNLAIAPDMSQADANAALSDWVALATITSGCSPNGVSNTAPATAPDVCVGGSIMVDFNFFTACQTETCMAEFTVPPATIAANPIGGATLCIGSTLTLDGTPSGGSGDYSHSWVVLPSSTGSGTFSDANAQETDFTATTDGTINVEYTVTDNISGCTATGSVDIIVPDECEFEFKIDDPCVCNNDADVNADNGTFMELIVVTGPGGSVLPNGQSWSFTELTGAYSPSPFMEENTPGPQGALLVAGQSMTYCGLPGGCTVYNSASGNQLMAPFGSYYLAFAHVDAEGYCGSVQGPNPDTDMDPTTVEAGNQVLSICNTCFYPTPSILNMPSSICIADSPINIQGTPVTTGVPTWNGEATFTGGDPPYGYAVLPGLTDNGDGTATFDPQAAGVGTHIISYTFEDQSALGSSEPGCFQAVQSAITVSGLPDASWTAPGPFCYNESPNPVLTGLNAGGVFTGNGVVFDDGLLIGDPSDDSYTFDISLAGIGNHAVCYTINDVCVSTVCNNINVFDNPPVLTCPADTIVDSDAGLCSAVVNDLLSSVSDDCDLSTITFDVNGSTIINGNGDVSGTVFNVGTSVVTYSASDANGNNVSCDFLVIVNDDEAPANLACPADNITLECGDALPSPTDLVGLGVTDNCTALVDLTLVVQDVSNNLSICDANLTVTRTYIIEDESGNVSSCFQTLQYVQDTTGPNITAPDSLSLACGDDIAGAINSWLQSYTAVNDNCTVANNVAVSNDYDLANLPNLCGGGTLTVNFTAADNCGNETLVSSGIVVAPDTIAPTFINCPNDLIVGVDVDQCEANVVFSTPVADDCNGILSLTQTMGGASGSTFPLGSTAIEFTAVDNCGNTDTCNFNIIIEDTDIPLILCPSNDVVQCTDSGVCSWDGDNSVMYTAALENCPDYSITHEVTGATTVPANTPGSVVGTSFEKGTSVVTYTIMDANGNPVNSCSFNVIVEDCEDPTIMCPVDIAVDNDAGLCGAVVTYDDPLINDNCTFGMGPLVQTEGLVSGSLFPVGTTTNTFVVTDSAGNTATCSFDVVVEDNELPTLTYCDAFLPNLICFNGLVFDLSDTIGGALTLDVSAFVQGSSHICPEYEVNISFSPDIADTLLVLTCDDIGITNLMIFATVITPTGEMLSNFCSTFVELQDNMGICPTMISRTGDFGKLHSGDERDLSGFNARQGGSARQGAFGDILLNTDTLGTTGDCAAQYEWVPPTPADNCELASYKVTYTNPDNTVDGPFDLSPFGTVLPGANGILNRNFDVGTTTILYTVEDIHGNTNTSSCDVIVSDNENPSFVNCPDPGFTLDVFTNDCETGVFWNVPLAVDNCGANVTIDETNNSNHPTTGLEIVPGDLLPPGTYTVAYLATDAAGNMDSCQFVINVLDTENPVIECPSQSIFTINGTNPDCEYLHTGNTLDATVNENCVGISLTHNYTSATSGDSSTLAGHTFPLGITQVVWTATDAAGNSSVCSFVVTVQDDDNPIIECPAGSPFNFDNDAGLCGHQIVGSDLDATATDNCTSPIDATNDYNNITSLDGAIFPVGITDVVWTSTDDAGNESSCTIQVVVNDVENPSLTCMPDLSLDTRPTWTLCERQYNWQHPLPTDNCEVTVYNFRIQRADASIDGPYDLSALLVTGAPGNLFNATYDFPVGLSIVRYFASDAAGNISECTFEVLVLDKTNPVFLDCPGPGFTLDVFTNDCEASAFWDIPIAIDNCYQVNVMVDGPNNSNNPNGTDIMPGDLLTPGVYTVAYIAMDNAGNTANCMFNINVIDTEDPVLTCPSQSVVTIKGTDESCEFVMMSDEFDATYIENCNELLSLTHDFTSATSMDVTTLSGHTFPLGNTDVTWTAVDTSGNSAFCSFIVTVEDDDAPIVECPMGSPFTFDSDMGECSLTILGSVLDATATDNCTDPIDAINDFTNTNTLDGAVFAVGTTLVKWTAIDEAGNRGNCEISITVEDNEDPIVDCTTIDPMNPQMTEMIMCENEFAWSHPLPTDNCELNIYTYQITNPDGTVNGPFTLSEILSGGARETEYAFEEGTSTVAYFVEDVNGNTDACSFDVTVVDDDMPYFADCPTQIIVGNDPDQCSAQVNWVTPHAFDNCTAPILVIADSTNVYASGDTIPVGGPYIIVYTATDNEGNTATCDFEIIVNDTQEPEILAGKPQNETVACDNVPVPLVLNANDVEDNCTAMPTIAFNQASTQDPDPAVCAHYNYTLTNMWSVSDETGNTQDWEQIVTVQDVVSPVITVPADMTVECTGPNMPLSFMCDTTLGIYAPDAAFVVYGLPSVSDNCAPEDFICVEFSDVFIPGTCGFTGVIERTWTATDPCGNTSNGLQRITIEDNTAPDFTCMDITIQLDEMGMASIGANDVIVGGVAGVVDACTDPADLNFQMSPTKFDCNDVGLNEVTLTVTDDCGNSAACLFVVQVEDNLPPVITCPNDVSIQLDAGECRTIISNRAQATDNCSFEITYSPDISDFLEIGENIVTATATDPSGNSASCTFTVNIYEFIPATNELSCNNNINLSLGGDCTAVINADMILEGNNYRCYENYCITIETSSGIPHDNYFTLADVGKTFKVSITDCLGSNNSCWGYITVEEKLIPEIECPDNVSITCNQDANARDLSGQLLTGEVKLMSCEPSANITYEDDFIDNGQCANPRGVIYRTWRVTDNSGNEVTCVQEITIEALMLDNVVFPINFEGSTALTCKEVGDNEFLTEPLFTGYPTLNGEEINLTSNLCMTSINYSDERFDICNGSFEILRTWKVRNMCLPVSSTNPLVGVQLIKVLDVDGPVIGPCPKDTIISTNPWSCTAELELPIPQKIEDVCSNEADFEVSIFGGGRIETTGDLATGTLKITALDMECDKTYTIRYEFKDPCGNISKCTFDVSVIDRVGPVASAKRDVVVSLTAGGPGITGTAKLYASNLDNYSYDNCSGVYMEVRRDNAPACGNTGINGHNNNNTFDNTYHNNDNVNDTDDGEFVKFCCEDLTAIEVDANGDGKVDSLDIGYVQVFLRVWDDGNKSGIYGDIVNGQPDNFNETWSFVKVENKLPPIIVCPDDATIYCDWGINVSSDFGPGFQNVNQANFDKTGVAVAYSTCGAEEVFFNDNINLNECGVGTIIRQFEATTQSKTGVKKVTCQQVISVLPRPTQFSVIPPNPTPLTVGCDLTQEDLNKRLPTVTGGVCDVIGENVKIDTFLFENGVCKKWIAEYNYYNWCTDESMGPFYAFFIYEDTEDPVIADCEDKMFPVDGNCETVLTLTNSATDGGGCIDNGWLKWQLYVDTWADGTVGHFASSFVSPTIYRNWKAVPSNDPILPQGHIYNDVVWVKYIEPTSSLNNDEVSVTLDMEVLPGNMSNHKVSWKVTDGCHNYGSCSYNVMVVDKKKPTPYCVSLSSALMADGTVELWARDFDKGSFDNCTVQDDLWFTFNEMKGAFKDTIIRVGNRDYLVNASVPQYFDENGFIDFDGDGGAYPVAKTVTLGKYNNGDIQRWVPEYKSSSKVFDCDEFVAQGPNGVSVKMSVWDNKCNSDFCTVYLTLLDNQGECDAGMRSTVSGEIRTESGDLLMDVQVTITGDVNDLISTKVVDGIYEFNFLPHSVNYTITADKDKDYMNGISTLDLVLMQRHILGLQPLESEYKLIAADVNGDMNIRASDLVELRKLILGITDRFEAPSWQFVDAEDQLSMNTPLDYIEAIQIDDLQSDVVGQDFMAVKMGDVNGNAKANLRSQITEPRSGKTIFLLAEEQTVKAGENVSVEITSSNFKEVFGYQFTAQLTGLKYNHIYSGAIEINDANIGDYQEGFITASWNADELMTISDNEVLFTINFVATKDGKLSNMIQLNSSMTKAESYTGADLEVSNIDLIVRENEEEAVQYALYQNEPNPFKDVTTITYEMVENGKANFTFYDVTGKVVLVKSEDAQKGLNALEVRAGEFKSSGMIYYQFESGDYTATKKMLIIK